MGQHQKVFGELYVNMIRAGEHSGALDAVLVAARRVHRRPGAAEAEGDRHDDLPGDHGRRRRRHPRFLMTVVVPKVTQIFDDMKGLCRCRPGILIFTSNALQHYWYVFLFLLAACGIYGFYRWIR